MYDELVKSIHCCFGFEEPAVTDCENCMMKDKREEYNYEGCCDALGLAAADAIRELTRENESLAKSVNEASEILRKRWIPVTERLPETGEIVLVYGKRGGIYTAEHNRNARWLGSFWKLNSKSHHCEPTHWMPLPEPPKEER